MDKNASAIDQAIAQMPPPVAKVARWAKDRPVPAILVMFGVLLVAGMASEYAGKLMPSSGIAGGGSGPALLAPAPIRPDVLGDPSSAPPLTGPHPGQSHPSVRSGAVTARVQPLDGFMLPPPSDRFARPRGQ